MSKSANFLAKRGETGRDTQDETQDSLNLKEVSRRSSRKRRAPAKLRVGGGGDLTTGKKAKKLKPLGKSLTEKSRVDKHGGPTKGVRKG